MVEVDAAVVIRQRQTFPKEPLRNWPPYPSGLDPKRHMAARARGAVGTYRYQ